MKFCRFAPLLLVVLASCESTSGGSGVDPETISQPLSAQFRCKGGETLKVENLGSSVNVVKGEGPAVSLPALPTGSRSRYSEGQTAIVFDGRDALFMITGKPPLECKR